MSETPKSAETTKVPESANTKKQLPHVQELKKLDTTSKQLESIRQKQGVSRGKKLQKSQEEDADKALLDGLGSEPGTLLKTQEQTSKTSVETIESDDQKLERELRNTKSMYQTQLKKTYETHIADLKDNPEEQKRTGQEYLGRCIKDLKINSGTPGENDVKLIATSLPDVWEQTLLDPKSAENNPEIKKMRDVILDRVSDGAASIDRGDFATDKEYQDALRQNFEDITGVKLDPKKAQELFDANSQATDQASSEARLAGALGNTLGKEFNGNPETRSWDDVGTVPEIGVCSENFPSSEELQGAIQNISNDVGVSESKNPQRIGEYHAAAGLNAGPSTPWCMSFVQYMSRKYLGYKGPPTASARAGLSMGNKINNPEPGSIVITRGSGPSGCHIGICVGEGKYISGNSGNAVKIKPIPNGSQYRSLQKSTEPSLEPSLVGQ